MCNLSVRAFSAKGASVLAILCVMAGSRAASARDRLAVVIVADGDEELADSLTEVAISSLAERGDHELVGARELRVKLSELRSAPKLDTCVVQPACLARLGRAVGARRAVIGAVRKNGTDSTLELALVDTDSGVKDANWSRVVREDVGSLVSAVATGVKRSVRGQGLDAERGGVIAGQPCAGHDAWFRRAQRGSVSTRSPDKSMTTTSEALHGPHIWARPRSRSASWPSRRRRSPETRPERRCWEAPARTCRRT